VRKRSIIQMALVGAVVGAALALVAWLIPWLPEPASEQAAGFDNTYWFVTIVCVFVFAVVAGVSVYAVWKFRAAPDDLDDGSPIHGHTGLEIVWTAIPAILVTAISVYSGIVLYDIERLPDGHRVVEVSSQQFAWTFTYPDQKVTSGELVLPLNEPTELVLTSKDVVHSFWVPEWRVKQDAVKGIETKVSVTPNKMGTFTVVCTELCGLGHAVMRARARVVSQTKFEDWIAERKRAAAMGGQARGKQLFTQSVGQTAPCGSCHALADAGTEMQIGPNLDEALQGKDAAFVRESIVNPDAAIAEGFSAGLMPKNYGEVMSDAQLDSLVEYLLEAAGKG
jgi:cytochrome c oxidase subunit II